MSGALLRFAPSPTGRLHLGHAYSALLNERLARSLGGRWLLRIEDIDPVRATPANLEGILEDLAWLGLRWPEPVRRQSAHMETYRAAGETLRAAGLVYPCFCSRGDVAAAVAAREAEGAGWPRDPDGAPLYPGTCRALSGDEAAARIAAGAPHAWRLHMARAAEGAAGLSWRAFDPEGGGEREVRATPARWGDAVIRRKEVPTSYHLSVVLDDAAQGITHVARGCDLEAATDLHALLAARLGVATPRYHHHDLVRDPAGGKLSKSRGSLSLAAMREAGASARGIRRRLGF